MFKCVKCMYLNYISIEVLKKKNTTQELESYKDGLKPFSILISDLQNKGILQKLGIFVIE